MSGCIALLIAFCFFAGNNHCGNFPEKPFADSENYKWTRRYLNYVYGYGVNIPKGLTGYSDLPPSPQHGFGIVLSWESRAYLYFDGSYNSFEAKNTKELEQLHLKWLEEESGQIISIKKYKTRLGSLTARRYVAERKCKNKAGIFIEDNTILLHKGIVYSACLLTTQERYASDKAVLEKMLRTWRLTHRE